nr:unnamed protein product [Timema bartmani]
MWVMPSSSARCAQLPRAADKVPFYAALKKFRDYLNGIIADLDESEVVFSDSKLKNYFEPEVKEEPKDEHSCYAYGRLPSNGELTDLSNAVVKKDDQPPAKKKRGRPKKVKSDCPEVKKTGAEIQRKEPEHSDVPKKKRGRPKKIKTEDIMMSSNQHLEHKGTPTPLPNCFSPPIHSPSNFNQQLNQQNLTNYNNQVSQSYSQNQSQSPSESHNYHQSPLQSQHYNQSPQPPSQPFTHSDLSSEISAAISSEHNLGSPSPTSPSIGPPDFEPPTSMPEDTSDDQQNSTRGVKNEMSPNNSQKPNECCFSSPDPSNDASNMNYQNYRNYQTDSETNHSVIGYSQGSAPEYGAKRNMNQDVSSKSLSGLESLVDQIPSIAEGETPHGAVGNSNGEEQFDSPHIPTSQFNDESAYLGVYPNSSQYNNGSNSSNSSSYSPQFSSSSTNYSVSTSNSYSLHQSSASMNFSVTSLANSSASVNNEVSSQVSSSFSVSSLAASNYASMNTNVNSYSNLISAPHPMGSHMMGGTNSIGTPMFGGGMSGGIVERACSMGSSMGSLGSTVALPNHMNGMNMGSSSLPYPYRQYSHGASTYPGGPPGGFPYTPTHGLHVPSPNYPYPSPYSNSTYPQPSYLPNHVLDRIKQDRMDIGFGGF